MIQRYTISLAKKRLSQRFETAIMVDYKANYNAQQGNLLPVITNAHADRVSLFQWGLVPFDAKDSQIGDKLLNARTETIKAKAPFSDLLSTKRCIILMDGYYVWKDVHGVKTPYRVAMKDESCFAVAGLWDEWQMEDDEKSLFGSFTMITSQASEITDQIEDRMPVILPAHQEKKWLDKDLSIDDCMEFLQPFDPTALRMYKVPTLVNNTNMNSSRLIKELNNTGQGHTLSLFD